MSEETVTIPDAKVDRALRRSMIATLIARRSGRSTTLQSEILE
jgi:hypothetical protein